MGDRASIFITSKSLANPIELYGHWAGTDGLTAVAKVLKRTDRIGDTSYLIAQVFYEFAVIQGGYTGHLGFGIRSVETIGSSGWNDNPDIILNADNGSVQYLDKLYEPTEFIAVWLPIPIE